MIPGMRRPSPIFALWTLQGLIALTWLALLPSDAENGLLFGFSFSRLILIGIILALAGLSAALAWHTRRTAFSLRPAQHDTLFLASVIAALLAPTSIIILRALGQTSGFIYTAYAERLAPLAFWFTLSGLELALCLAWNERKAITASLLPAKSLLRFTHYSF